MFNCRFDEVAPLARLLWASYERDQADFKDLLSDDYDARFAKAYGTRLQAVEALVAPAVQQAQGMTFTAEIAALYEALPTLLNPLEARAPG
jgi:hypothetical protein